MRPTDSIQASVISASEDELQLYGTGASFLNIGSRH